jgi:hypothetical protein
MQQQKLVQQQLLLLATCWQQRPLGLRPAQQQI